MSDFEKELEAARRHVGTQWSAEDQAHIRGAMRATLRRRQTAARVGGVAAVVLVLSATVFWKTRKTDSPTATVATRPLSRPTPESVTTKSEVPPPAAMAKIEAAVPKPARKSEEGTLLPDGTRIRPGRGARWQLAQATAKLVRVKLERGKIVLDVPHRKDRRFVVEAGRVRVVDLGTVFTVEREGKRIHISVQTGRVRIEATKGLTAGGPTARTMAAGDALSVDETLRASSSPKHKWQKLAHQGRYTQAFALMSAPENPVSDDAGSLLLAADVARWSGHPSEAIQYLRKFLSLYAKDERGPLAAFTLGRVLLLDLSNPRDAAAAFARARTLDGSGPLAEDAWVREVESWSQAGDASRARAVADAFAQSHPDSARLGEVRSLVEGR